MSVCLPVHVTHVPCVEVKEQPLVLALTFHFLWNMVSSFSLPWTPGKLALRLLGVLPSLTPIFLEKCWSTGIAGHATVWAFYLGCRDSNWGSHVCIANASPPETSPWPLCNNFLFEITIGCLYPKAKDKDLAIDYKCWSLTQWVLWDGIQAFLLDWKMAWSSDL